MPTPVAVTQFGGQRLSPVIGIALEGNLLSRTNHSLQSS